MGGQKLLAALDQGTTSTRCILFDQRGKPVASAQAEHAQLMPAPGFLEHDPLEILARTAQVVAEALQKAGETASGLAALGITNQRETCLLWDRETGRPLHNALVWQDTRTQKICDRLEAAGLGPKIAAITGLPISTYFSAAKLLWLLENVPDAREKAWAGRILFGTIDSWLLWNLTGGVDGGRHVTDVTNASRTMLMDLKSLNWSEELLGDLGLPVGILPSILPSSHPTLYGCTAPDSPFGGEVLIGGALGDQQAALTGQACFERGEAKNTYGTGCFLLMNVGAAPVASKNGLLSTVAHQFGDEPASYALEGSVAVAGAAVQWLRDQLKIIKTSAEVEALARSVADNGGVYFVPAFFGLFAPHWRADARGTVVGLTRYATGAHLARATLEAVAYQTRDVIEAMERDCGAPLKSLKVDGGMTENILLLELQAQILGVPVVKPAHAESTALGAAFAAGLAAGIFRNTAHLKALWREGASFYPTTDDTLATTGHRKWKAALEKAKGWETPALSHSGKSLYS